jgi:hypothetical protein
VRLQALGQIGENCTRNRSGCMKIQQLAPFSAIGDAQSYDFTLAISHISLIINEVFHRDFE